jgi:hypothetical protein
MNSQARPVPADALQTMRMKMAKGERVQGPM